VKLDILFAGVGGQGVLSMAAVIGHAAAAEGLRAKQSEVHGMAQRGGAVQAHLRIADDVIESDLVPLGAADLILSLEPVEALRYLAYLSPGGALVTSGDPFRNIPDYPDVAALVARIRTLPRAIVVDAGRLATAAGDVQAVNTVMVGAASHVLPLPPESLEAALVAIYARKGDAVVAANRRAFRLGREAAEAVGAPR
jgi:indolepyruvate ferredoxin oxidoreductase beta subunit